MLIPKEQFRNTVISIKVGNATIQLKAEDITHKHIEAYKNHVDLSYFVEDTVISEEPRQQYDPKKHDAESIIQAVINASVEPKKTRTRKKK